MSSLYNAAGLALSILFAMSATVKVVAGNFFAAHLESLGFGRNSQLLARLVALVEAALSVFLLLSPGAVAAAGAAAFVVVATVISVASRTRQGNGNGISSCYCFSAHEVSTRQLVVRNLGVLLLAVAAAHAKFRGLQSTPLLVAACLGATSRLAIPALRLRSPDTKDVI